MNKNILLLINTISIYSKYCAFNVLDIDRFKKNATPDDLKLMTDLIIEYVLDAIDDKSEDKIVHKINKLILSYREYNFKPRGIGVGTAKKCFCCGKNISYGNKGSINDFVNDMAAFVETKIEGLAILNYFGKDRAWLDYREHEPRRIQLKIGVCSKHEKILEDFYNEVSTTNKISGRIIKDYQIKKSKKGQ